LARAPRWQAIRLPISTRVAEYIDVCIRKCVATIVPQGARRLAGSTQSLGFFFGLVEEAISLLFRRGGRQGSCERLRLKT
jgi:hypothetical protein